METNQENSLTAALRHFEVAEANLMKLQRIWKEIESLIPEGIAFGTNTEYEDKCRSYESVLLHLPKIDNFKPTSYPLDLSAIGQSRFDAAEIDELGATIAIEEEISSPGRELAEYRYRLNQKRRELVRDSLFGLIDSVDTDIRTIGRKFEEGESIFKEGWNNLENHIREIDTLLGSTKRPPRWSDLQRHLHFAEEGDFRDIEKMDWPSVKSGLSENLYEDNEPIPGTIDDLAVLVISKPTGRVTKELKWNTLTPASFERLIFSLINMEPGYENPQWLTHTNAPDRGRDLSVIRVINDALGGVTRHRVIIQCKHWLTRSVSIEDIATLQAQMKLWEPPRVDVHIIVTTGRFTTDAVAFIEAQNLSDHALRLEMWPESHLEMVLDLTP
jgi:hypothetical protein